MQCDAWYLGRARSNPPPGCLWWLWRSASTLTEPFRPDGNIFCWCGRFEIWALPYCFRVDHMAFRVDVAIGYGVGCLRRPGRRAVVPWRLQRVWGLCAVPSWQGRQPSIWFCQIIAGCLSIAAFPFLCPGNKTAHFFSSRTSAWGFLIRNCVSSIVVRKNPPLAILPIFKTRRMSDCSSCTQPPFLAIVAYMLKTYKRSVAASTD